MERANEMAKRFAEEANKRPGDALVTQKLPEGNSEIEKFGAVLQSFTQELQRVTHELSLISDAKNEGLSHVSKITEIHATVEMISTTLLQPPVEVQTSETREVVENLKEQLKASRDREEMSQKIMERLSLVILQASTEAKEAREKLEKAKSLEATLSEAERIIERLSVELEAAKKSELEVCQSLDSKIKQIGEQSVVIEESRSEISSLRETLKSLQLSQERQRVKLEKSKQLLDVAKHGASKMEGVVETLKSELQNVKEEKQHALEKVQNLAEERKKLLSDLEALKQKNKVNPSNPTVFFEISIGGASAGRIIIELFADVTPRTAENFRQLCTGEKGMGTMGKPLHYKGSKFFCISSNSCAGGDITSENGRGGESIYGKRFINENSNNKHMGVGTLYMYNYGEGNGSMFFFSNSSISGTHGIANIVIGHVVEGIDIVEAIKNTGNAGTAGGTKEVVIVDCGQLF